jgi:hypothetical protein
MSPLAALGRHDPVYEREGDGIGNGGKASVSNSILYKINDPSCRLRERSERMETSHDKRVECIFTTCQSLFEVHPMSIHPRSCIVQYRYLYF